MLAWAWMIAGCQEAGESDPDPDPDDACDPITWYRDADGDGFGDPASSVEACERPEGYVDNDLDCDDADPDVYPGAAEACNGRDDSCSGTPDHPVPESAPLWWPDADGDGFGDADAEPIQACERPEGYVDNDLDCDDTDPDVHPNADEICDGIDNSCSGLIDADDPAVIDAALWWPDADGDGFGDADATPVVACERPEGYVDNDLDCDDTDADVYPGAIETCNGRDDSCSGIPDDPPPSDAPWWWVDLDGDGYGAGGSEPIQACDQPEGYVDNDLDCDDSDPLRYPTALEVPGDGIDRNCNGYPDTAPFTFGTFEWEAPRRPVVGRTEHHYMLVTTADALDTGSVAHTYPAVALAFEPDARPGDGPSSMLTWHILSASNDYPLGHGVAMASPGGDRVFVATTVVLPSGATNLIARRIVYDTETGAYGTNLINQTHTGSGFAPYLDADIRVDGDGLVWVAACRGDVMTYLCASDAGSFSRLTGGTVVNESVAFETCFLDVDAGEGHALATSCTADGCVSYRASSTADDLSLAADQPHAAQDYSQAHTHEPHHVFVLRSGGVRITDGTVSHDVLEDYDVRQADMSRVGDMYFVAAVVEDQTGDGIDDVLVAYGTEGMLAQGWFSWAGLLPFTDDGEVLEPSHVAIFADADRIFLAVTGSDRVGWVFLGGP